LVLALALVWLQSSQRVKELEHHIRSYAYAPALWPLKSILGARSISISISPIECRNTARREEWGGGGVRSEDGRRHDVSTIIRCTRAWVLHAYRTRILQLGIKYRVLGSVSGPPA
jgi:hypothetical protein